MLLFIRLSFMPVHIFWCCKCTVSFQFIFSPLCFKILAALRSMFFLLLLLINISFSLKYLPCCVLLNYLLHISGFHHPQACHLHRQRMLSFFLFLFSYFYFCLFGILYRSCVIVVFVLAIFVVTVLHLCSGYLKITREKKKKKKKM